MNYHKFALPLAGTLCFSGAIVLQADDSWPDQDRVQLGLRSGFNLSLKLRNVADGFVGTDNTGNGNGRTTYWGYQNASQVVDGNNYLVLQNASGQLGSALEEDLNPGLEVTWDHELIRRDRVHLGLESAFNWMEFSIHQTYVAPAGENAYPLGYTPPSAPFTGTRSLAPYAPTLGTAATGLPLTVTPDFEANLYGFRLGPYLDLPINHRLLLTLSAGMTLTLVDCQFSYTQTFITPGGTTVPGSGSASDFGAVVGGYVGVQGSVKLLDHLNLFTGMQYQASDSYDITAGSKQAVLDFGNAWYWTLGLSYSF